MAFAEQDLDPSVEFDAVPNNEVQMITGKGQMVWWKGCNVTVYETDKNGKQITRALFGKPDGQGVVIDGVKLYITAGKFIEGNEDEQQ